MRMKCSLSVRNTQILVPAFHNIAISEKTKSFGTFCLFFLNDMDLWHYPLNYSKRFIKNEVYKF